jgi:hypothetical protein
MPPFVRGAVEGEQAAFRIPRGVNDRVEQAVDDDAILGDGGRNGIHQERHVVVDDGDAHPAVTDLPAQRFQAHQGHARGPAIGAGQDELGGFPRRCFIEAIQLARQGVGAQPLAE